MRTLNKSGTKTPPRLDPKDRRPTLPGRGDREPDPKPDRGEEDNAISRGEGSGEHPT